MKYHGVRVDALTESIPRSARPLTILLFWTRRIEKRSSFGEVGWLATGKHKNGCTTRCG